MTSPITTRGPRPAKRPRPSPRVAADMALERLMDLLGHEDPQVVLGAAKLLLEQAPAPEPYPQIRKIHGTIFRGGAEALVEESA